MKKQIVLYFDMDDTFVDFTKGDPNANNPVLRKFDKERGFFYNLEPLRKNLKAVKRAVASEKFKVYILTASPNKRCDNDKIKWLNKYLPNLAQDNIIITRVGEVKGHYIRERGILFDDFKRNTKQWERTTKCGTRVVRSDGQIAKELKKLMRAYA